MSLLTGGTMPKISYEGDDTVEKMILKRITHNDHLRKSAPPAKYPQKINGEFKFATGEEHLAAISYYVWRMVAFMISPVPGHHCMPVMASSKLPGFETEAKIWDKLVDKIVDAVPKTEWAGIRRWSTLI